MTSKRPFPENWIVATISDVSSKATQRKPEENEIFTYVDIGSIDRETKVIATPQTLKGCDAPSRARKVIHSGDVLVSLTRPNLNAVALVSDQFHGQIASTGFEVIKPIIVDNRVVYYLTRSKDFIDHISGAVQGALYPAAKSPDVQKYQFGLPPLAEQKVIADKLDELLAQVDTLKARLDAVPAILKRFRQSVLAAAVSGKLTENWREKNQLSGGSFSKIENIATVVRGGSPRPSGHPDYFGGDIHWITVKEITKDRFKHLEGTSDYLTEQGKTKSRFIENGTLLLTNSGATLGVPKISKISGCINDGVVAILNIDEPLKNYLYYVLLSMTNALRQLNQGAAQPNLNTGIVKNIEFLLPEQKEQIEIVRRVEQLFTYADQVEQQVKNAQSRVNQITQAILAKAFRGELTEQWRKDNPDLICGDNSAEALLQRIKAERAAQQPKKKTRARKVKA